LLPWSPQSQPQWKAWHSEADELFFGGSAGGGKTDFILGMAFCQHTNSLILRRESVQLRSMVDRSREIGGKKGEYNNTEKRWRMKDGKSIEFGGCEHETDKENYRGRPHDLKAFDEVTSFTLTQYQFIIGWNRSTIPGQKCRVISAGNPPTTVEGRWVVSEWGPWLDKKNPIRALPGELRWYARIDDKLTWLDNGQPILHKGEKILPRSRTFIPASLRDNKFLSGTGYEAVLQSYPEPLRSQLLYGDFDSSIQDDPWQVIPTAWVLAAMDRWKPGGREYYKQDCLGVDVSYGGSDSTVISERRETWFNTLKKYQGVITDKGSKAAALVLQVFEPGSMANIDVIGYGAACHESLEGQIGQKAVAVNVAAGTNKTDRSGKLKMSNVRSAMYWRMREALDPEFGDNLQLPDDPELLADLTAPKYELRSSGICVESKEDIKKRLGRSPDCGDAVCLAQWQGDQVAFLPSGWSFGGSI